MARSASAGELHKSPNQARKIRVGEKKKKRVIYVNLAQITNIHSEVFTDELLISTNSLRSGSSVVWVLPCIYLQAT